MKVMGRSHDECLTHPHPRLYWMLDCKTRARYCPCSRQCQDRNASIIDYQETLLEREKIGVEVKRLTAQLTRVNEQVAKNNIDPSTPVLAEFMESALEEQKFFLMRELYKEHVKMMSIDALPELSVFQVYSGSMVADLSAMHARCEDAPNTAQS